MKISNIQVKFKILIIMLSIYLLAHPFLSSNGLCYDKDAHFPSILDNESRKIKPEPDMPVKKSKIFFTDKGRKISGILVNPADIKDKKYPAILFLQINDEKPEQWIDRITSLAGKGYVVMSVNYENSLDVEISLENLMKLDMVDTSKIGVLGVHQGGTEAMLLAIRKSKNVNCIVSIAGRPPYDIPGGEPAKKIFCPILLIHGNVDDQVPPSVSQYFYDICKNLGRPPVKIMFLQNTRHYYNDAEWSQMQLEFVKFFDIHLKGKPDPDAKKN